MDFPVAAVIHLSLSPPFHPLSTYRNLYAVAMGSSASKASRAANSAARVYPKAASKAATNAPKPTPAGRASQPGPTVRPQPQISETRDEAINHDAADPAFAAQLRSLGPVASNPYTSNSSTSPYEPHRQPPEPSTTVSSSLPPTSSRRHDATTSNNKLSKDTTSNNLPDFSTGPTPFGPPTGGPLPPRTLNPALTILSARERIALEAEREFAELGRRGAPGRRFLDVVELRKVLILRDQRGRAPAEIERQLGLREGVLEGLGPRGVVEAV
ncbi:uncharacterized protein BKCO1_9000100 [Diplodia corticola]|uniref:Helix-turn-helix domain-containing protein n=1 Tax=Diplodia corticola TaxID=236234 RepID=A0A1J9S8E1_9PEZI|nr:uncharacterized protein BKCO1_9000100 [Diplodia corticola]OJD36775.1 hypothetical protein BKCO1_9000100 [Diplodia corticola]